ncbi:MAG TPA: hopanoid biosynthesis-associated protein HpnK [Candidatus Binatia bacterium]|nr:hopanoid biosynthesis-associated protein HpnK [Candidatus Binatia bacterium]
MSDRPARRRLIVNGDDFGLAPEVNRGIVRAHRDGILTSTSLMVAAPAVAEAVELARATPSLAVGLHLVLVQGTPASPEAARAGLARRGGGFRESAIPAALLYFFVPRLRAAVADEIRAQLAAFRATGLRVSHVDGHLNIHLHPVAQRVLAEVAREFAIPAVRLTRDPLLENLRFDRRHAFRKTFEGTAFRVLSRIAERRFAPLGIASTTGLYGLHQSGACDETYLERVLASLPPGDFELYCHPAEADTLELQRLMPGYVHARELAALTSPRIRAIVADRGIELATYADLAAG